VKPHDRPSYTSPSRNGVGHSVGARVDEERWGAALIACTDSLSDSRIHSEV